MHNYPKANSRELIGNCLPKVLQCLLKDLKSKYKTCLIILKFRNSIKVL